MSINLGWIQSSSCTITHSREFYCLFNCTLINDDDNIKPVYCEGNFVHPIVTPATNISSAYNLFSRLINYTINGQLHVYHFRSICWHIFLGILSNNVNDWTKQLKTDKEYFTKLNYQVNSDPHNHLKLNDHPLSYHTTSSWNKYFYAVQKDIQKSS
ncbi:unnamed protein product [Heterobilharzia americana]|nr:unnamed protein product [Heterobilharzia americana]CAH8478093.1 unnamed protein product [Heterobilharzia americana]